VKSRFIDTLESYDGSQLKPLRNYLKYQILGDSIVAWVGPCDVKPEHMIDGEDLLAGAEIRGESMLHFIMELFDSTLFAGVAIQRLMAGTVRDVLQATSNQAAVVDVLRRDGDDIYSGDKKFSISIATQSPTSTLIHFAVNAVNRGTPVPTISLQEFGLDAKTFAHEVMRRMCGEIESIRDATKKVKSV
jgi:hypothetical protein